MTVNEGYHFIRDALTPIYNQREAGNIAALVIEKITGLQKTDRLMKKALVLPQDQEIQSGIIPLNFSGMNRYNMYWARPGFTDCRCTWIKTY